MTFIETPTNGLVDTVMVRQVADTISQAQGHTPIFACDNTLLGPVFQRPIEHGTDLSLYFVIKYIGGHSDLIAGAALGSKALNERYQGAALRHRHPTGSAFLLDAQLVARNAPATYHEFIIGWNN